MFRRSLFIFGAIVFLGLLLTVGYALLRFRGPGDEIADAQALFDRREYLQVVADLDLAEHDRSMQRDPSKLAELLRLRYQSHLALRNGVAALRDLDRLLAESSAGGRELQLDHIRLLAMTGSGELALQEARTLLAESPDDGRALELAGEACQSIYRDELKAVFAALELDVGAQTNREARPAALAYLYRPDADAEVRQAIESLRQLYAGQSQLVAAWPPLSKRLDRLRARVQESIGYFQKSLEHDDEPVAAFRGMALSLLQSQRFDDLLILCECYRRRFDHKYVHEAGAIASWALVHLGLNESAIHTTTRWLAPGTAAERQAAGKIGDAVLDLFLARIVAAWHLRDVQTLQRMRPDLSALLDAGLPLQLAVALVAGFSSFLRENAESCESNFHWATGIVVRAATPHGQQDLLPLILPARVENLQRMGASDEAITTIYELWQRVRPNAIEPLVALAEYRLATGKYNGAMVTARAAQALSPASDELLALRVRVARVLYRDSDQDGPGLLMQCKKRNILVPEVPDPICYLLCGEAALALAVPEVALACGRRAIDAMPWARAGRLLEARAELLAERPEVAAQILQKVVESMPPDQETLQLALDAFRQSGVPAARLLWIAVRNAPPSDALAADLLRRLQRDAPSAAMPLARALAPRGDLPADLTILTASAFARNGDRATAARLLHSLSAGDPALDASRADLADVVVALLELFAEDGPTDEALAAQARQWIEQFDLATPAAAPRLIAVAHSLAEKFPSTAYSLLALALAVADPDARSGESHALAGDLAFRLRQLALAEQHWTAALAFPDGRIAAEPLARFCLATDRPERALQVYRLASNPSDPALALRCGKPAAAKRLAAAALLRDGGDLLTHVVLAILGQPSLAVDLTIDTDAERDSVLELISLLRSEQLATLALPRARRLAESKPVQSAELLLARAQSLAGNAREAARLHARLWEAGQLALPYWREVAAASCRPGYELSPAIDTGFAAAAAGNQLDKSPFAAAVAIMRTASIVEASGHPELALVYRTPVWLRFSADQELPPHCRPSLADADALVRAERPLDAWWVLDRLRPTLNGRDRVTAVERMLAIAERVGAAATPEQQGQLETIYGAVLGLAASEGPFGSVVHYLLRHADRYPALAPKPARVFELLKGHLGLAAAGRDGSDLVDATIARLIADHDRTVTLEVIEGALREHPLALELWSARTRLLQELLRGPEGIADLRAVLAHVSSPEHVLDLVGQAALGLSLTTADVEALKAIDPKLADTPAGMLVRGLVAMRRGLPDQAVALLEETGELGGRNDEHAPVRLMALAQALLQSKLDDAVGRARQALEQLATDYPSSSQARYAGSFARQLAPR